MCFYNLNAVRGFRGIQTERVQAEPVSIATGFAYFPARLFVMSIRIPTPFTHNQIN